MRLDIRGRDIWLTGALLQHVERRLRGALKRFATRVREVKVRVADVNGRRGGIDKRCRVVVRLAPFGHVAVEDVDRNLYAAIARAVDRTGRRVGRKVERLRERRLVAGRDPQLITG
jgi:putative sigma-54 modulation protein